MAKLKFQIEQLVTPNSKAPKYAQKRAKDGLTAIIVEQNGDGYYTVQWSDGEEFKVQSSHYDSAESTSEEAATGQAPKEHSFASDLSAEVRSFIDQNNSEIEKIEKEIRPQLDTLTERQVVNTLAEGLNQVPSPKVYKLMHKLIELNPNLGELTLVELYKKAESVLEDTLA